MEKRKEFNTGEPLNCPKCNSYNLDMDGLPDDAKCLDCGLSFTVKRLAVWEE